MQLTTPNAASRPLTLDVELTPSLASISAEQRARTTHIVVDVIRATTTLSLLFDCGCARVLLAPGIAQARAARESLGTDGLLAGEVGGARPPGFDLGNSPSEIAHANLHGRSVIFATTNGTRALRACAGGRAVLAGCLRNAAAVCSAAVDSALAPENPTRLTIPAIPSNPGSGGASEAKQPHRQPDIVIVCSGRGDRPAYDDTLCAGYLIRELVRCAAVHGRESSLTEGARIALAVLEAAEHRGSLLAALASSDAAQAIARIGLASDLEWCAATDTSECVPALAGAAIAGELVVLMDCRLHGSGSCPA